MSQDDKNKDLATNRLLNILRGVGEEENDESRDGRDLFPESPGQSGSTNFTSDSKSPDEEDPFSDLLHSLLTESEREEQRKSVDEPLPEIFSLRRKTDGESGTEPPSDENDGSAEHRPESERTDRTSQSSDDPVLTDLEFEGFELSDHSGDSPDSRELPDEEIRFDFEYEEEATTEISQDNITPDEPETEGSIPGNGPSDIADHGDGERNSPRREFEIEEDWFDDQDTDHEASAPDTETDVHSVSPGRDESVTDSGKESELLPGAMDYGPGNGETASEPKRTQAPGESHAEDTSRSRTDHTSGIFTGLFSGRKRKLGIDIGTYAIKYVELSGSGTPVLHDYGYHVIPEPARTDMEARKEFIRKTLSSLLERKNRKRVQLHLSVSGREVSIRNLQLPGVSESELEEAVHWATKKHISYPIDEALIDYTVYESDGESGVEKHDLLIAAAAKSEVDFQLREIRKAGYTPAHLSLNPLATWQAYLRFFEEPAAENVMIVELGEGTSFINLIHENTLRFVREISVAGEEFTEALTGNIGSGSVQRSLSTDQADELKKTCGIPRDVHDEDASEMGIPLRQIATRLRSPLEKLVNELERSLKYYQKELGYGAVDRIYITGGGALLRNLIPYLRTNLQSASGSEPTIELLNPAEHLRLDESLDSPEQFAALAPAMTVPIGLVLGQKRELNLLPEELKLLPRKAKVRVITTIAAVVLMGIMAGASFFMHRENTNAAAHLAAVRSEYEQIAPQRGAYISTVERRDQLAREVHQLAGRVRSGTIDERPLILLSQLIPENMALQRMHLGLGEANRRLIITLNGNVYSPPIQAELTLIRFNQQLMESKYFSDVLLEKKQRIQEKSFEGLSFKLSLTIE